MGLSETTFRAWLEKAGLPTEVSSVVAEHFGAEYLAVQGQFRGNGASAKSKALAAVEICRQGLKRIEEHACNDAIDNPGNALLLLQASHLAGCTAFAGVAASVYGLDETGKDFDRAFGSCIGVITASAKAADVPGFDFGPLIEAYGEQRALVAFEAKRQAANKGFLTRWLG